MGEVYCSTNIKWRLGSASDNVYYYAPGWFYVDDDENTYGPYRSEKDAWAKKRRLEANRDTFN